MRLTYKQLATMLDHPDSPLIPAVGLLYVRYVVDPKEVGLVCMCVCEGAGV